MRTKIWTGFSLVLVSMLLAAAVGALPNSVQAAPLASGAIWTTDGSCGDSSQDVNQFDIGDTVYINGSGFDSGSYGWQIKGQPGGASADPNIVVASGTVTVYWYSGGTFCFAAYVVAADDDGEYSVKVGTKGDNYHVDGQEAQPASVAVDSVCSYANGVTTTGVNLTITGATLTINGGSYTISQFVSLAPGSYPYTWTANAGYTGSGSGTLVVVDDCTPPEGSASVTPVCSYNADTGITTTGVNINVSGASVTINGSSYSTSQFVALSVGSYPWTWAATSGYIGSGSDTAVVVDNCTPPPGQASASVTPSCSYDAESGVTTLGVNISVTGAEVTINGSTYGSSGFVALSAGSYPWTWAATSGYIGSGSDTAVVVDNCTPLPPDKASVSVDAVCSFDEGLTTGANLTITGATVSLNGGSYSSTQFVSLAPGSYPYTWTANSGYTGSGSGTLEVTDDCTPGQAKVTVVPACQYTQGEVTGAEMGITGAILTINGSEYSESGFIPLPPGVYPYSWVAIEGFTGSGEGRIIVPEHCNQLVEILKVLWRAVCKDNCGAARWETPSGPANWQSNDLLGKETPGIMWSSVNDDCYVTPKGCILLTFKYGVSEVDEFTVIDRGREFHSFKNVGADGKTYNMFVGYTITCFENEDTSAEECGKILEDLPLPNGWTAYNLSDDGYSVVPATDGTPIYWEWSCSLAPGFYFTTADGKAYNMPGTVDSDWIVFLMKSGYRDWPNTWPDDPQKGFWIWGKDPMKDTRAWATTLKDLKEWETLALPSQ